MSTAQSVSSASKKIWTSGCIEIVRVWAERNLYVFAGVALTCSFVQLLIIYLAKTLEGKIKAQAARWSIFNWLTLSLLGQIELQKSRWTSTWVGVTQSNSHFLWTLAQKQGWQIFAEQLRYYLPWVHELAIFSSIEAQMFDHLVAKFPRKNVFSYRFSFNT